jgi:uncharacterized protein YbbC (DUF1343 family)
MSRLLLTGLCLSFLWGPLEARIKTGLENLLEHHLHLIKGKRLGIIANHTSLDVRGRHIVDLLSRHARVTAVFGPEHGFRGNVEDAVSIEGDAYKDIRIYSLYGEYLSPTPQMLRDVEVLIYDIQDVGVKFYTFVSNLFLAMGEASRAGIPVIVLDRPNPINAVRVEGAVTSPAFTSFVGVIPMPIRYGMTVGELAELFNRERFGGFQIAADLTVVPMTGYRRSMWYDETGLPWIGTSPNMQTLETAVIYPGMCLLEGSNLSEGRGTDSPFLTVGAPFVKPREWLNALPEDVLAGVAVEPVEFEPRAIPGVVSKPKYLGEKCRGLRFRIQDRDSLRPIPLAVALLCSARCLYPERFQATKYLDKLWGNENLRAMLGEGVDYEAILATCRKGIERFSSLRNRYLRYE